MTIQINKWVYKRTLYEWKLYFEKKFKKRFKNYNKYVRKAINKVRKKGLIVNEDNNRC